MRYVFCVILVWALLCGCSNEESGTLTFSVGGAPAEVAYWGQVIDTFSARTGIAVDVVRQPTDSDQRRQGLVVALQARNSDPDVFLMDVAWLPQMAASGWLQPLDSFAADESPAQVFFRRVLQQADTYGGQLVALPVYVDGGILYYRTDLLDSLGYAAPPDTWDVLVAYAQRAQNRMRSDNADFYGFVWQGAQYEGLITNFLEYAASHGGGIEVSDGTIRVNTPENRAALEYMRALIYESQISPPNTYTEFKEEEVRSYFQTGNAMFERNWSYAWPLHQADDSPVKDKVGIAVLPHFEGYSSASTLGGWHIGMSRFSDAQPEAWRLIEFITSYETQKQLALNLGWTPGRPDVYGDSAVLAQLPHFADLQPVFENAYARPAVPYYTQISEVLQKHIHSVLAGNQPPESALAQAEQEAQQVVARYTE